MAAIDGNRRSMQIAGQADTYAIKIHGNSSMPRHSAMGLHLTICELLRARGQNHFKARKRHAPLADTDRHGLILFGQNQSHMWRAA
jgi:hypothetical protein